MFDPAPEQSLLVADGVPATSKPPVDPSGANGGVEVVSCDNHVDNDLVDRASSRRSSVDGLVRMIAENAVASAATSTPDTSRTMITCEMNFGQSFVAQLQASTGFLLLQLPLLKIIVQTFNRVANAQQAFFGASQFQVGLSATFLKHLNLAPFFGE